jgi:GNAT superfamily N-acetyltransferase
MPEQETVKELADGTKVLIRAVRPEDRVLIARGFERFGPKSRYMRFFTPKEELTDEDLRYLTEVDGNDHFALGAIMQDAEGQWQPVGIARFVRLSPGSEVAEAAVAVVDDMQGKGVGRLLLRALSDAAYARGVRRFRCSVLATNDAVSKVLQDLKPKARVVRSDAGVKELEFDVLPPRNGEGENGVRPQVDKLLRLLARRAVSWVPSGLLSPKD